MRRAKVDDSVTWEPFDHGRGRRMAALVAVGFCAGLVGLVVGRVSSGGSVEIARAPPPQSAVTTKNQTAFAPPVVLANPVTEKQTSRNRKEIPSRGSEPMPLPVNPERQTLPAPVPAVGKQNNQALPPASPPVVLLNPGSGQQNADVRERPVPEQARERRQHSLASDPTSEKRDEQEVRPARAAPWQRQQQSANRSPSTEASPSPKTRVLRSERPASFADYGALRDYMMRQ